MRVFKLAISLGIVAVLAIATITSAAAEPGEDRNSKPKQSFELAVPPNESRTVTLRGPAGETATVTVTNTPLNSAESAPAGNEFEREGGVGTESHMGTYQHHCVISWVGDIGGVEFYRMTLIANSYYDFHQVWGPTSSLGVSSIFPYSWSNPSHSNVLTSSQYAQANGQATLEYRPTGWPPAWTRTYHLWITQAYDGYCWGSGYTT